MSRSAFFGAWLGTWCWLAIGLLLWLCGSSFIAWIRNPWRRIDWMKRNKNFTDKQWRTFCAELQKVASAQRQQIRIAELNEENEEKVKALSERMRLAKERAVEVYCVLPENSREQLVLEKVVLLLDPNVCMNGINLDTHMTKR